MSDQKRDTSSASSSGKLGMGSEASEGLHAQQQGGARDVEEKSSLEGRDAASTNKSDPSSAAGAGGERKGSEPLTRTSEHTPSYGGKGGAPRTSSDTREPQSKDPGTP
jgi:hypothetical protein